MRTAMAFRWALALGAVSTSFATDRVAPAFSVSLDAKPEDRWGHVGLGIINYHGGFNSTYLPVLEWLDNKIPASAWNLLDPLMNALQAAYGDYDAEMRGFYSAVIAAYPWANSSGIFTFDKLIMLQMAYEFGAMCTSIAANQENGTIIHARNLDYNIPLKNLTASITFTRGNGVAYYGTAFVGYMGLLTGMRPGGWSVSVDERDQNGTVFENFLEDVIVAAQGGHLVRRGRQVGFLLRDALDQQPTFDAALAHLTASKTVMRMYIAVAGVSGNEGAIITRNRESVDDSHGLAWGVRRIDVAADAWYRIVTNYDLWLPDPPKDPRRTVAEQAMNATGHTGVSAASLWDVLSTPPVLNSGTMYTTIMSAATGVYEVWVRNTDY